MANRSNPRLSFFRYARPMAAMSMILAVPLTASAMAAVESSTRAELARFMDVFQEVKANYVEPVEDSRLVSSARVELSTAAIALAVSGTARIIDIAAIGRA